MSHLHYRTRCRLYGNPCRCQTRRVLPRVRHPALRHKHRSRSEPQSGSSEEVQFEFVVPSCDEVWTSKKQLTFLRNTFEFLATKGDRACLRGHFRLENAGTG